MSFLWDATDLKMILNSDKSANHCNGEDPDMCWYIKPLKLATHNTQLNTSSELLALGELIEPSDSEINMFSTY